MRAATAPSGSANPVANRLRREFHIDGIVQGVGFRPFVYGLALRHGLAGYVLNDANGVTIGAEGSPEQLASFARETAGTGAAAEPHRSFQREGTALRS